WRRIGPRGDCLSFEPAAAEVVVLDDEVKRKGPWRQALSRYMRHPAGVVAFAVLVALFLLGALAGALAPYEPARAFLEFINQPQPPFTKGHILGTDVIGHDFLSQLLYAIRESVVSSLVCALGATVIGTIVGALAGFYGGWFDTFVTWIT